MSTTKKDDTSRIDNLTDAEAVALKAKLDAIEAAEQRKALSANSINEIPTSEHKKTLQLQRKKLHGTRLLKVFEQNPVLSQAIEEKLDGEAAAAKEKSEKPEEDAKEADAKKSGK